MKKIFLLFVAAFLSTALFSENVDQNKALRIAKAFVSQHDRNTAQLKTDIVYSHPMPNKRDAAFYVVNIENSGFIIVAANDVAHPVIGYSFDRPWPTEGNIPPQITDYLDDLAGQIEAASQNQPDQATKAEWQELLAINPNNPPQPKGNRTQVGPLLTTTWDQGQYYNAMCPEDANGPDGHCVTGCVATAMAQIINYHQYPESGRGTHSYQSNYGTLTMNYETETYDYANMPNALSSQSTEAQVNAVAQLIRNCGIAVNMGYTSYESSAYDQEARAALINFFKYSPDASFAEKAFFSVNEWDAMLKTELDANRPVFYSGRGTGGHAFVCDGYNSDGYYHFNFGWSGSGNTWYLLDAVNPLGMNFNSDQSAILGIIPDANGNVILGQMNGNSTFTVYEPLEFYHIMGHNLYEGANYINPCNNTVYFIPADETNQMVVDIMEYEDQNLTINDGNGAWLRSFLGGENNDMSPVVSTANAISITYSGILYYAGFKLSVSQDTGCRMVSNITSSIEATTVHLTWTENGGATQWQVEYGIKGFEFGEGTVHNTATNTVTFENLEKFTEYDFYIRSICGDNQFGLWNKVTLMVEAEYWQDIVTSQPEGYSYNQSLNRVEISSAEGFAWWARNGCNDDVYLTNDIDLSDFKWRPTRLNSNIFGQGHIVSNLYISEMTPDVGLFSDCMLNRIMENVGLINAHVYGSSFRVGGLFGTFRGIMRNCYVVNSSIDGTDYTGGLIGESVDGTVINCYVNVNVLGSRWTGLMIGDSGQGINRNCYAAGTLRHRTYCYNAGIAAYAGAGEITNCYSVKTEMGVVGYGGSTYIADTSTFIQSGTGWTLLTPIVFDDVSETDLLSALNQGVAQFNDNLYCIWIADTENNNGGYPVLGDKYIVQCPNVSDVSVQNVRVGDNNAVAVSWTEIGDAIQWCIRYRRHDLPNSDYTYIITTNNPYTIMDIPLGYVYDFNVRALCDENSHSGWSLTNTMIVDLPYWTDYVTSQPAGYVEDNNGNVEISSAEGLAWLAAKVNGFHGQQPVIFEGKTVALTADINLEGYRWYPIGRNKRNNPDEYSWLRFSGCFDGQNHIISNIYINDACSELGLFGHINEGVVKNVIMEGGSVASIFSQVSEETNSIPSSNIGGIIGYAQNLKEVSNCHSSVNVHGSECVGSLCGYLRGNDNSAAAIVFNCSATGSVSGREACGGLLGTAYGNIIIKNCYSTGNVDITSEGRNAWYRGGLIGNFMFATAYNCYSIGNVAYDIVSVFNFLSANNEGYTSMGNVIGCPYLNTHIHYIYGQDNINEGWELTGNFCEDISDTTQFHHENDANTLLTPVSINGIAYTDLLEALNGWVTSQNDQNLNTWTLDGDTGYPVFGNFFEPSCYNPTDLTVSQATVVGDPIIRTELYWNQIGEPDHWEVLYVASEHNINEGTIVSVDNNPFILTGIPTGNPLDFYVRAIGGNNDVSNWSNPVTYIPDKLRWTEVVTSQPDGYTEDADGNVYISSAEGLAWLSSVVNGLNGLTQQTSFWDKKIYVMTDIDLSLYRWTPIGNSWDKALEECEIVGNNHTINGLYCNELADYVGLLGFFNSGKLHDLNISQCNIWGKEYTGGIAARTGADIFNCIVTGNIYGIEKVGGVAGYHHGNSIKNVCFLGNAVVRRDITKTNTIGSYIGGICGSPWMDTISNCYTVCEIEDTDYSGIIGGSGSLTGEVSNCYWKDYQTSIPIAADCIMFNNSSFSGSGTTWTLNTPPYVNGEFRFDLLDALNAWVDANNTNGEYLQWVADTENQNGGFPMLKQLPAQEYQIQQLASGWNWYSTYIEQNDADGLSMLEEGLGSHGELIMSRTGAMVENFEGSFWWGDLNAVTNEEMYEIKTNAQTNVVLTGGKAMPSSHPITVAPGWNWIGYVSNTSNSIDNALSSLTSNEDDIIQSRNAFSSYFPGYGWYGDLENMTPGQGYMYKSNGTVSQTLVYPTASRSNESEAIAYHNQANYNRYRNVMDVMAKVIINGEPANSNRYELAAFVDGECRGRAKLQYVEPIETYLAFITINGNEGEEVTFSLYDEDRAEIYEADDSNIVLFRPNEVIGKFRAPYIIRFSNAVTEGTTLFTIYPNPVDKNTEFTIDIPTNERISEVIITNSVGSIIRDERALKGNVLKGLSHSGVYNIQIITEQGNNYRGRVIVK